MGSSAIEQSAAYAFQMIREDLARLDHSSFLRHVASNKVRAYKIADDYAFQFRRILVPQKIIFIDCFNLIYWYV